MSTEREILADRIQQKLDELGPGVTARSISVTATGKPDAIRDLQRGKGTPNGVTLGKIAAALGTTTDWLLGRTSRDEPPLSEVGFSDVRQDWRGPAGSGPKIRVLGTGYCDDLEVPDDGHVLRVEQTCFEPGNVVQLVSCPPALLGMPDVYAIYFYGSSMEPRFFQGDIGYVIPKAPPAPGDFVVVQLNDGTADEVVHVLVKRLVRVTGTFVELEQYNPQLKFRLDRKRVTRMHRIAGWNDFAR